MGVTPLTPTQLWTNHRIKVEIPIVGNVVKVLQEYNEPNQSLKDNLRGSRMGRRGTAVVRHPEGGRDRRQGPRDGPVGGRIIAEVLVGLLQKDPNSYLYCSPPGSPRHP